ncbi:MAG: hypothetical protein M3M88_06640, partial [Thermoproteota archaeon]|nr:hypothetical protein [Thermoproteota archaeon]
MMTILSFNVLFLFLVLVITGTSTAEIFHQDIAGQILNQGGSNGISFGMGGLFGTTNPVLFDPHNGTNLHQDIAGQILNQGGSNGIS